MTTWRGEDEPQAEHVTSLGWMRVVLRGSALALLCYGGLLVLLLVRLMERPLCGLDRPVSPFITQFVCRGALRILGLQLRTEGQPMRHKGAVVANHSSWLDIFVLNASQRIYFVSKAEVARWPGIGWLARATGTVFINREGREARAQKDLFEARLRAGHKLLFFPEGTSTDGLRVLPFKSTLFAAFFAPGLYDVLHLQPVSLSYHAPAGTDPRFYGWWGDMDFGPHLLKILSRSGSGCVRVVFHDPVRVEDFPHRKALANHCEAKVRLGAGAFSPAVREVS